MTVDTDFTCVKLVTQVANHLTQRLRWCRPHPPRYGSFAFDLPTSGLVRNPPAVVVTDAAGQPLPGKYARVQVRLVNSPSNTPPMYVPRARAPCVCMCVCECECVSECECVVCARRASGARFGR